MKLPKFLVVIFIVTLFSLLYVYQQTEIFCLGYQGGRRSATFEELLDKNNLLRYNINVMTSLPQIGNNLLEDAEFEIPDAYQKVSLEPELKKTRSPTRLAKVFSFFSLKATAEAQTIK